jgi:pilus assembly protein CpaB
MPPPLILGRLPHKAVPAIMAVALALVVMGLLQSERARYEKQYQKKLQALQADYKSPIEVVMAQRDVPAGKVIEEADLQLTPIPERFVQPYATQFGGDLIGRVALAPIAKGEQVLSNKLRGATDLPLDATLAGLTPEGKRAVTIEVDYRTGVGGFVRPGDKVDVIWTLRLSKEQGGDPVAVTLFQDVMVLAVGSEMMGRAVSEKEASNVYMVTLALGPQETALLLYAREQGPLQLTLRPRSDQAGVVAVSPANSAVMTKMLMGDRAPAPPSRPPRLVELIKGSERTVVSINE